MEEENRLWFLRELKKLADEYETSVENLLNIVKFAGFVLWNWGKEGQNKEPEGVFYHSDIAEIVRKVRSLREAMKEATCEKLS